MGMTHLSVSSRNALAAITATFFGNLAFILPIWILFGTEQLGLSVTTTTVLFMALWLTSGLLEIPTGALADRYGRKKIFLIGVGLLALYPLVYIFELPVTVIFLISLVAAFGSALRSGALMPLVHDSYKKEGRSDQDYHRYLSNEHMLMFIARAISGIAGGVMYAVNPRLPYVAIFVSYIGMFIAGLCVTETTASRSTLSNRLHITEALRFIKRVPIIIALLVSYIAFQLVGEAVWTAYQPLYISDGISAEGIGLIFSAIAIISTIGAFASRLFMRKIGVLKLQLIIGFMIFLTCLMLVSPSHTIRILAIVPSAFVFGVTLPPLIAVAQKHIATKFHSTVLSVINVVQYVVYGITSLYIAVILDHFGTQTTRKILLGEAVIVMFILSVVYLRNKQWDEVITPKDAPKETSILAI